MPNLSQPPRPAPGPSQLVISLGAGHVAGALIGRAGDRVTVARYAREDLDPDPAGDGDWVFRAGKALARLARSQRWRGEATVLLPGHLTLTKRLRTPATGDAGREAALLFAAQQNLPEALENLTWDGVVLADDGLDLDLLLGAARAPVVQAIVDAVTRAELKVAHLRPPGLPPPGPWLEPGQSGVLVNLGARSTLLYYCWPDGWWTRRIGTAGNSVTRLMARALDADFATAQRLKPESPGEPYDPGLTEIRRAATREFAELLAAEIRRTTLTYGCGGGSDRPQQVWLTGGGSRLAGLAAALSDGLDRPVHTVDLTAGASFLAPADHDGVADLLTIAALPAGGRDDRPAGAVGPAGWPDLLPWKMKLAQAAAKRRRVTLVASAMVALAPLAVAWGYGQQAARLDREQARLEGELAPRRREAVADRELAGRAEAARRELAAWEKIGAQASSWPGFLGGLEAAVAGVGGVWLERLAPVAAAPGRAGGDGTGPRQLGVVGHLVTGAPEAAGATPEDAPVRMQRLTQALARLPEVAAVTGERFDRRGNGDLRFECVLNLRDESFL